MLKFLIFMFVLFIWVDVMHMQDQLTRIEFAILQPAPPDTLQVPAIGLDFAAPDSTTIPALRDTLQ